MNEIKIHVDDKNLETLLTILNNLKASLVSDIQINGKSITTVNTQYKAKTNISLEDNSYSNNGGGKYINPAAFKQRLKK